MASAQVIIESQDAASSQRNSVAFISAVPIRREVGHNNRLTSQEHLQRLAALKNRKANMPQDSASQINDDKDFEKSVDAKLVLRVQKGDKKAFDLLVIKYQNKVAAVVSRFISDYHEIADVSQEAFIKAYRAINNFRGDSAFYTWLYRIAINCAKNYLVAKGRRAPTTDLDAEESLTAVNSPNMQDVASPERELDKEQLEKVVWNAINALPEDLKVAFTLREFDGLSYEEIAEVMACPVGTVRSRIFRARESVDKEIRAMSEACN